MTTTAVGILLIVQCVVLWAIMAALHRHTREFEALRKRIDELRQLQDAMPGQPAPVDAGAGARHDAGPRTPAATDDPRPPRTARRLPR